MKKIILISLLLIIGITQLLYAQERKRIFFIGNSYTHYNNMPNMLSNLALSLGDTVVHSSSTPGGAQLVQHVGNASTLNGIRQGNWDVVVIQEQSQKPSFPDAQVATDVYPYAAQLSDSINTHNPCATVAFFMTWGRKKGDAQNCPFLPALCTFDGMNARLRRAYLTMADDNQGIAAPVGAVWKAVRDSFPTLELYQADESHPSVAGSYLIACTFYASFFRKPVTGASYTASLSATDALHIQEMVDLVVLDSVSNWYLDRYDTKAAFTSNTNAAQVSFTNTSTNAQTYQWDFGDGSPVDTTANPSHSYFLPNTYTVTLIATDSCGQQDTTTQNITISTIVATSTVPSLVPAVKVYPNPSNGQFHLHCSTGIAALKIVNALGQEMLYLENLGQQVQHITLDGEEFKGVHYLFIRDEQGQEWVKQLFIF